MTETISSRPTVAPARTYPLSRRILKIGLGLGLVLFFVYRSDTSKLRAAILSADGPLLAVGFAVSALNFLLAVFRWQVLMRPHGIRGRYRAILHLLMVGTFFNTFLPGGVAGDYVRAMQSRKLGLGGGAAFSTVIADRLIGMLSLLAMSAIGLLLSWGALRRAGLSTYGVAAAGCMTAAITILSSRTVLTALTHALKDRGAVGKAMESFALGMDELRGNRSPLILASGISVVNTIGMIVSIYLFSLSLGASVPFVHFLTFVPIVNVMSMVPITVGGLGIREAGFVLLFGAVGMEPALALGTSLLFFCVIVAFGLLGGLIYLAGTISSDES